MSPLAAHAGKSKPKVDWKPGITLAADVLTADGTQAQTFPTPAGPVLWDGTQLIPQGDKIRLNVFVSTGGVGLGEIKVRLDNGLIADIKNSPWNTVVDTATLTSGHHMFDVWAQATGNPPLDNTSQLMFVVGPPAIGLKDYPPTVGSTPDTAPALPVALAGQPTDANARVNVFYRDASVPETAPGTAVSSTDPTISITAPTSIDIQPAPGSAATQFVYALARGTTIIQEAQTPYALPTVTPPQHTLIRIQEATATQPGLLPGTVALWVWGVDAQGRAGNPLKVALQLP